MNHAEHVMDRLGSSLLAPSIEEPTSEFARAIVKRAQAAQKAWGTTSWSRREAAMKTIRHGLVRHASDLATICSELRDCPAAEAWASEIIPLTEACRFLEKKARHILRSRHLPGARLIPNPWRTRAMVHREPYGVVLIIAPANYPLFLAAAQALQAVAAGNAVLMKPAPSCSPLLLEFIKLLGGADIPSSLVQVLPEAQAFAQAVMDHGVDKVIVTGSAMTGRQVMTRLADRWTPSIMELSGCDMAYVRPDADLDLATKALVFGATLNHGATCMAPKRILAAREIATALEGRLTRALADVDPVPLPRIAARKLLDMWPSAAEQGAHLMAGSLGPGEQATGPLLLAGLPKDHPLMQDDLFAPVMSFTVVDSDRDALEVAERCPYALGASLFSADQTTAHRLASRLRAGVVTINDMIAPTADPRLPFGGCGKSGFGCTRGREGLLELTRAKVVTFTAGSTRYHFEPPCLEDASLLQHLLTLKHSQHFWARGRAFIQLLKTVIQRRDRRKKS